MNTRIRTAPVIDRPRAMHMAAIACTQGLVALVIDPSRPRGLPRNVNAGGGDFYFHLRPDDEHLPRVQAHADLVLKLNRVA